MKVFKCNHCSRVHLEIGNTQIHFNSRRDLKIYLESLDAVDTAYYAALNRGKGLTKVIILPLASDNTVHIAFTVNEFEMLKATIREYLSNDKKISKRNFYKSSSVGVTTSIARPVNPDDTGAACR